MSPPHECMCGHPDDIHLRRVGRCLGTGPDGNACECVFFERDPVVTAETEKGQAVHVRQPPPNPPQEAK